MKVVHVDLPHADYRIIVARRVLDSARGREALSRAVHGRRCAIVTDSNVGPLYADRFRAATLRAGAETASVATFAAGESSKTLTTLESLYHFGVREGLDRGSVVLALGGGVVGDVAGFFAATFLRGVPFVQVPTTLLALVDSSVGGKVAVDLPEGKNLVGAFYQPQLVLAELSFMSALPVAELRCGLAEVVKYAVILDHELFAVLEDEAERILAPDLPVCERIVARCCRLKAEVVAADEKELGQRAILNYGHTFGHALEMLGEYSAFSHGEAIAVGMGMAADLAVSLGLAPAELVRRQDALLQRCGLPLRTGARLSAAAEQVLAHMYRDKKVRSGRLRLVLPTRIGRVVVTGCEDEPRLLQAIGDRIG